MYNNVYECTCTLYAFYRAVSHTAPLSQSSGGGDPGARVLELKLKALILDAIHCISIVRSLLGDKVETTGHWLWQKQLRFYLTPGGGGGGGGMCRLEMVDAAFDYTYEYQGNSPKLVHTPLTDKCYLTLTQGEGLCLA